MIFLGILLGQICPVYAEKNLDICVVNVCAERQNLQKKFIDSSLSSYKTYLVTLRQYNSFRILGKEKRLRVRVGRLYNLKINENYTVIVRPLGLDQQKRTHLEVSIIECRYKDGKFRKKLALKTVCYISRGKCLGLCGLPLDKGELIVILAIPPNAAGR